MTEHDGAARSEAPLSYTLRSFLACSMVGLTSFSASAMVDLSWILCTAHSIPQYMGLGKLGGGQSSLPVLSILRRSCCFWYFSLLWVTFTKRCLRQNTSQLDTPTLGWSPARWRFPAVSADPTDPCCSHSCPDAPIVVLMLKLVSWCCDQFPEAQSIVLILPSLSWCSTCWPDAVINFLMLPSLSWCLKCCPFPVDAIPVLVF